MPMTTLVFKLEIQKRGESTFSYMCEGEGQYNLFMGPNIVNNILKFGILVIE